MSDIFIAYSRSDATAAERLVQHFRQEGWEVFIDKQTPVGRRWDKKIEQELRAAKAVVVLWSVTSRDSDYVLEEAEYGKRKDILFPAIIELVECPYGFGRIQTADLVGWDQQTEHTGLVQLLESLRVHLSVKIFQDNLQSGLKGPSMAVIPAGHFLMGSSESELNRSDDEGPQHEVHIARPFALGVYAVTFDEYDLFCQEIGRDKPREKRSWGRENRPVINVSWHDAQAYCDWLSEQTEKSYRLPSEAEWEYACRAGTQTLFYTGETISFDQANFNPNYGKTLPVGSFSPNAFGLYDMHGNVFEWIEDCWHGSYHNAPNVGCAWLRTNGGECDRRVVRGGSWESNPLFLRSADRGSYETNYAFDDLGFRIARDL